MRRGPQRGLTDEQQRRMVREASQRPRGQGKNKAVARESAPQMRTRLRTIEALLAVPAGCPEDTLTPSQRRLYAAVAAALGREIAKEEA